MTEERATPLRQRMIEGMRIRGMGDKAQKSHIRAIKDFAVFLGRSPVRHPDGSTRAGAEVSRGPQHFLWCRAQGCRGLQSQDRRYRQ